jgi:hypothetical protein
MSSFVVAPATAACVPAVCRKSWKRNPRQGRQWARNVADAAEKTRRAEAEREAQIERELEEGRRQAAERAKREPRRVLHGVEVSLPGDPAPPWMGDQ